MYIKINQFRLKEDSVDECLPAIEEYVSAKAMGDDGYLSERGLVVLPADKLKEVQEGARKAKKMAAK